MDPFSAERVKQVALIMGAEGVTSEEIESQILSLVGDAMTARRLIDWIPETFGLMVLPNMKLTPPRQFQARDAQGKWHAIDMSCEPIVATATEVGFQLWHGENPEAFKRLAGWSSSLQTVSNALNQGASLEGATLGGPALVGIPAEVYLAPAPPSSPSLWQRLFAKR